MFTCFGPKRKFKKRGVHSTYASGQWLSCDLSSHPDKWSNCSSSIKSGEVLGLMVLPSGYKSVLAASNKKDNNSCNQYNHN